MRFLTKRNRAILREMVSTDFKLRYQDSVLGYVWSLMRPMFMFVVLYLVFAVIFPVGKEVPNFAIYLLLGIVLWTFFLEVTSNGLNAVVGRGELLRKISIPRYLLVVSVSVSALINLALNLVVVAIFASISAVPLTFSILILPIIIAELYVFALALAFILAALYVRFRDVSHIWDIVTQAAFYATPIVYPVLKIPHELKPLIMASPLAQAIQDARYVVVTKQSETVWSVLGPRAYIPFLIVTALCIIAYYYFKHAQRSFAEEL